MTWEADYEGVFVCCNLVKEECEQFGGGGREGGMDGWVIMVDLVGFVLGMGMVELCLLTV